MFKVYFEIPENTFITQNKNKKKDYKIITCFFISI